MESVKKSKSLHPIAHGTKTNLNLRKYHNWSRGNEMCGGSDYFCDGGD